MSKTIDMAFLKEKIVNDQLVAELLRIIDELPPGTDVPMTVLSKARDPTDLRKLYRMTAMQAAAAASAAPRLAGREWPHVPQHGIDASILDQLDGDERLRAITDHYGSEEVRLGGKKTKTKKLHRLRNKKRKTRQKRKTMRKRKTMQKRNTMQKRKTRQKRKTI